MQRTWGCFTESLSSQPFPDNKVVILSCWVYPGERVLGDLEWSCPSMTVFAAVLGTASPSATCQHPAQLWVGSTGEPSRSQVTNQPVPANPPCRRTSFQHYIGTNPAGRGSNHYPKDILRRHLRGKCTACVLGLLFPESSTGNNTTRNNTFKLRGQPSVGICRHTLHVL